MGKLINRKATGYALLLTTAARDGGLRENTLKLHCCMVHPRTSQKYDKKVRGEGWDNQLKEMEDFLFNTFFYKDSLLLTTPTIRFGCFSFNL